MTNKTIHIGLLEPSYSVSALRKLKEKQSIANGQWNLTLLISAAVKEQNTSHENCATLQIVYVIILLCFLIN